jgi:hypothetical protein
MIPRMKHYPKFVLILATVLAVAFPSGYSVFAKERHPVAGQSPLADEMIAIVGAADLSETQKLEQIESRFTPDAYWIGYLRRLDSSNRPMTVHLAFRLFRKADAPHAQRYEVSRYLLQHGPPEFHAEYRDFLVNAILNGGAEEFCQPLTGQKTAVGEYSGIAGGIDAAQGITFEEVRDPRVIPVLIQCLRAPDQVLPENQGDVIRGKPGESTGRNTQRQGIPLALAKLGATDAIPALRDVLQKHPDDYLRANAAYALAVLLPREESRELEPALQTMKSQTSLRFAFGKGLIEKGLEDGIPFMSLRDAMDPSDPSLRWVLYHAEERLAVLSGMKSPKLAEFYGELLNNPAFAQALLAKEPTPADPAQAPFTDGARTVRAYAQVLTGLKAIDVHTYDELLRKIATQTANPEVRRMTEDYQQVHSTER